MNERRNERNQGALQLRRMAETRLADVATSAAPPPPTAEQLLHELQVHQIELEMQNEALRSTQNALEESRDRYYDLYEIAPVGYLTLTHTGRIAAVNLAGATLLGSERPNLLQQYFSKFVIPQDSDRWHLLFTRAIGQPEKIGIELTLRRIDGVTLDAHLDCLRTQAPGAAAELRVTLSDISAMQLNKQMLAAQDDLREQLLFQTSLLESIPVPVYYKDFAGRYLGCNRAFEEVLGKSRAEFIGKSVFDMAPPEIADTYRAKDAELFEQPGKQMYEWVIRKPDGEIRDVQFHKASFVRNDGTVGGLIGALVDITELKRYQGQLERHANYDDLTGLPNRNLLMDRLAYLVARCQREQKKLAVLVLNLNRFREINDSLGHAAGDSVLKETSERLSKLLRKMDTLARLESDEFVLAIEVADDAEDEAAFIARRIQEALALPMYLDGREISLQVSVGISILPRDGENGETLLNNALVAMHRIKGSGSSHFLFYATEMNADVQARFNLGNELRHAVERDELLLHYQPKLDLRNGEMIGMEALVRWQHPLRGMVSPAEFIPLAEAVGLIVPIGEWVMRTACLQNQAWHAAGLHTVPVAVNLSALQFQAQDIVALTAQVLNETGLDARYLELELTESTAMSDAEAFVGITERFKALSVNLSIDDFGTGYSSLSYLKRFAVDRLKIDQSFVRDIVQDPGSAAISVAIITLAHSLGLSVIAEGVETQAQLNFLRSHGCDEMQGYYFSKPLPAAEFEQLLRSGRKLSLTSSADVLENTLLLVDDEPSVLSALSRLFRHESYRIHTATSGQIALELLATHEVGVVISDQRMPHMTGAEFLARVRVMYPDTVRIILSGYTELSALTEVVNRGEIYKFLEKPWDEAALRQTLREAFRLYAARRAVRDK